MSPEVWRPEFQQVEIESIGIERGEGAVTLLSAVGYSLTKGCEQLSRANSPGNEPSRDP